MQLLGIGAVVRILGLSRLAWHVMLSLEKEESIEIMTQSESVSKKRKQGNCSDVGPFP
jgi:hypothetical protein